MKNYPVGTVNPVGYKFFFSRLEEKKSGRTEFVLSNRFRFLSVNPFEMSYSYYQDAQSQMLKTPLLAESHNF